MGIFTYSLRFLHPVLVEETNIPIGSLDGGPILPRKRRCDVGDVGGVLPR
jgi:hypothetical protein